MKDIEARRMIVDLEHRVKLELDEQLRLPKKNPPYVAIGRNYSGNFVSLESVVSAILEHLGLEVDYEEPTSGYLVLSKKEE